MDKSNLNSTFFIPDNSLVNIEAPYFIINLKGEILGVNDKAKSIFPSLLAKPIPSIDLTQIFKGYRENDIFENVLKYNGVTYKQDIYIEDKDVPVLVSIKPIVINDVEYYLICIEEIFNFETNCSLEDNCYSSIRTVSDILSSNLELNDTIYQVLNHLSDKYSCYHSCILYLDGYKLNIKPSVEFAQRVDLPQFIDIRVNKDFAEMLRFKVPIILNYKDNIHLFSQTFKLSQISDVIIIPLKIHESFFGLLLLFSKEKINFSLKEMFIVELFATCCAFSIKNVELSNILKTQLRILTENFIERTKALEFIKIKNQKIIEADRIKNEFIANMSHELRTPLNSIIGYSEALKLKFLGDLNPRQEEYIDDIHTSGIHLLGMINDILDLSKIEANKMELFLQEFSVELALNEVINIVLALANKKFILIKDNYTHANEIIRADHRKFQQIFYNLLSNAIKFSPDNSVIIVETSDAKLNRRKAIKISVVDKGIGIEQSNIDKIFEKFHQIDSSHSRMYSGTGLGLTITKQLVEMHGGRLEVESSLNEGSTFSVIIPVNQMIKKKNTNDGDSPL